MFKVRQHNNEHEVKEKKEKRNDKSLRNARVHESLLRRSKEKNAFLKMIFFFRKLERAENLILFLYLAVTSTWSELLFFFPCLSFSFSGVLRALVRKSILQSSTTGQRWKKKTKVADGNEKLLFGVRYCCQVPSLENPFTVVPQFPIRRKELTQKRVQNEE